MKIIEQFVVKHYTSEDAPSLKGNGFDGLRVGEDREEAERFVAYVNEFLKDAIAWRTLVASADATAVHVIGRAVEAPIAAAIRAYPSEPPITMFKERLIKQAMFRWVDEPGAQTLRDALVNLAAGNQ